MLDVCLLGCGGMLPLPKRFLTALILRHEGKSILIDCGEGTQVALHLCGWSLKQLDHILITHFHGDHVAGLPGLLMTIGNNGRTEPVHIWGGMGLEQILNGLMVICPQLPFQVVCHELSIKEGEHFQLGALLVESLPVLHRVPCLAYSVSLPRLGRFEVEKAKALGLPIQQWGVLQKGEAVFHEGRLVEPKEVMGEARKGLKVTYSTDCRPGEQLVELARSSDLYVAEGLYGDDEKLEGAKEKRHMIFSEAALVAKKAQVGEMWLTHYSPAMMDPEMYLDRAREIFAQSLCGTNLMFKTLKYQE